MGKKRHRSRAGLAAPGSSPAAGQRAPIGQRPERGAGARPDGRPDRSLAERIAALRRLTGWRLWLVNLATAVAIPTLLLAMAEGGLRLFGYGYPTGFCLRGKNSPVFVENEAFLWQFYSKKTNLRPNPFAVAVPKPVGVTRILVLGESAAAGTPDPAFNFGRILERMLRERFPRSTFEVINGAMRGVNSHILLPAARDGCARLAPDLVVVYTGNNEAVGLYAPGPNSGRLLSFPRLLRILQGARTTRLGQLMEPLLAGLSHEGVAPDKQDDEFFQHHRVAADDPRRAAVYDNFRRNLADLCRAARQAGARVLLMTVPVNLKDFPPLGSLHRTGLSDPDLLGWQRALDAGVELEAAGRHAEAMTNYQAALALDDHFAELHFRQARCAFALGQDERARREFTLACDWDALQFRADSRLNGIVRQTASRLQDPAVRLVDTERAVAESDPEERHIPGDRRFNDHVHPSFDGDCLLAKTLFPAVCDALGAGLGPASSPAAPVLSRDECAARLAFTRLDEARIAGDMLEATAYPPFTAQLEHARRQTEAAQRVQARFGQMTSDDLEAAAGIYRAAMARFPEDWWLPYNLARLRFRARDYPAAIEQFEAARRRLPHWPSIGLGLSAAFCGANRWEEALRLLTELQASHPQSEEVKAGLAVARGHGTRAVR
jgi:tetratricopeptide (TPR) repeat protein